MKLSLRVITTLCITLVCLSSIIQSRVYRYRHHKLSVGARKLLESPEEEQEQEEQNMDMITPLNVPDPYTMQLMATYNPTNIFHPFHPLNPMNLYRMSNPMFQGPLGLPGMPYMESYMVDMDEEKLKKLNSDNNLEVDKKIMDNEIKKRSDNAQDELNEDLYDLEFKTLN